MAPRKDDKQFDPTAVLEQAMDVFWEKGYEAAGMAELVDRMGIGRQSVYDTFGNKKDLYLSALRHYVDTRQAHVLTVLQGPGRPLERVRKVVRLWEQGALEPEHRGCMMVNGCSELGAKDADVTALSRASAERLERALRSVLEEAQSAGELRPGFEPRGLARTLVVLCHGLVSLGKTEPSKAQVREVTDTVLRVLSR